MIDDFLEINKPLKGYENATPKKALLFMVYPPTEFYPYYHYKNGFKAWEVCEVSSKITLLTSLITLAVSIIAFRLR